MLKNLKLIYCRLFSVLGGKLKFSDSDAVVYFDSILIANDPLPDKNLS